MQVRFLKFLLQIQQLLDFVHCCSQDSSIYSNWLSLTLLMTWASACSAQQYFRSDIQQDMLVIININDTNMKRLLIWLVVNILNVIFKNQLKFYYQFNPQNHFLTNNTSHQQTTTQLHIIKVVMSKFQLRHLTKAFEIQFYRARNVRTGLKRIIVTSAPNHSYQTIDQMWEVQMKNKKPAFKVIDPVGSIKNWYNKANQYWNKAQATYDGVLSGFGNMSQIDIAGSQKFLNQLKIQLPRLNFNSILDCGAGIGRISKELFVRYFKHVDIIDQCQKYVQKAKEILKQTTARNFYCNGLQDFNFTEKYDVIWIQWVLSHLTDEDAIEFFKKAKRSLNQNGVIVLKENHSDRGFLVDKEDYSVTRSSQMYRNLIERAGLKIIKQQAQPNWPESLFNVRMYALI